MPENNEVVKKAEKLNSLSRQHADELSKYTYFLLAVSGAAIAYALDKVGDKPVGYSLLFLAISVLLWAVSFGFGIRNLNLYRQHLSVNAHCILRDFSGQEMLETLKPYERSADFASKCQFSFLLGGSLSYLASCLFEAFYISPNN
jgi:hypothetical protein